MRVNNLIGESGKAILEYIAENDADRQELHAMMLDGRIPSPPDPKNWNRLCAALDGFYVRYGRWPTRVRAHPGSLADIRDDIFTPEDYAKIQAKVTLIEDGNSMVAEDDPGCSYDYGKEGLPDHRPAPMAAEWLGVKPRKSIYPPQSKHQNALTAAQSSQVKGQYMPTLSKSLSHGRIGEAAVSAKCWMHGIPAYNTGGLRANFAGSDLIIETGDPRKKLWVQVKTGAPIEKDRVYLTQCAGESDLKEEKFQADFVIFVNLDLKAAKSHLHDGSLDFNNLSYYVVPRKQANSLFFEAVKTAADKPKRDGHPRKLTNLAVHVPNKFMEKYRDAWAQLKTACPPEGQAANAPFPASDI